MTLVNLVFFEAKEGYFGSVGKAQTVLRSTHLVEQLSLSMLPSILTFDFDLVLGSFLTFWGPNGFFLGLG